MFWGGLHTAQSWLTATLATTRTAFLRCSGRKEPYAVQLARVLHKYISLYKADEILWPTGHSLKPKSMTTAHIHSCGRYHFLLSLLQMAPGAHCSLLKRF